MAKNKKRNKKQVISVLVAATMMAAAITGCGSASNEAGGNSSDTEAKEVAAETEKVFTWANNENSFSDLDEVNNFAVINQKLANIYGDTLFETDHVGNFEPWIATEWKWDDANLNITLKIRDDVDFQCGEHLTANDVAATYQRIVDNYSELINPSRWSKLTGAEAVDDTTCILSFSSPMPNFMECACQIPIICSKDYEANSDTFFSTTAFCTSGPFKVTTADFVNSVIELTRNDSWWAWTGENKTNVDKIVYKNITEDTTRVSSLRSGEITMAENVPYIDVDTLKSENFEVNTYPKDEHVYMVLNCNDGKIFQDEKIREAVSLCVDRELIVSSILGSGIASTWPCVNGDIGYVADSGYEYDPDKAAQLVTESNYSGEQIDMILASGVLVQGEEVAQAIQSMCAGAGININLEIMETATFNERKMAGDYDVCLSAWTSTMGDPYNELVEILGRTDMFKSGLVNQELFDLVDEITVTADRAERTQKMQEAFQMVMDQFGPDIYLYDAESNLCYSSDVSGITFYNDSVMDLRYMQMK